jgi:hypothetical protein
MPSPQYEHFRFKVGDFVQPISVTLGFGKKNGFFSRERGTPAMQIIERLYQECPGGVQLHYKVRGYFGEAAGYSREIDTFNEIELVPYTPPAEDESGK